MSDLLIVVAGIYLVLTDTVLGLAAVAVFPLLMGLNVVYQKRVDRHFDNAQQALGDFSGAVHESFEGVQLVKAYGAENRETERLSMMAGRIRDPWLRRTRGGAHSRVRPFGPQVRASRARSPASRRFTWPPAVPDRLPRSA